jgi:hypothetical protein
MSSVTAVLVPARRRALTTFARYREAYPDDEAAAGMTDQDIENLIGRATATIERYCGRVLARERVRETVHGGSLRYLLLSRRPVVEIHAAAAGSDVLVDGTGYALQGAGSGVLQVTHWSASDDERRWLEMGGPRLYDAKPAANVAYAVEYTGGYITPGWIEEGETAETPPDLPLDLEDACLELVRDMIAGRGRDPLVQQTRLGDFGETYRRPGEVAGALKATLDHYRAVPL